MIVSATGRVLQRMQRLALAFVILAALGVYHARASENDAAFSAYMTAWLKQPSLTFDGVKVETAPLRAFYEAQNYRAFWVDDDGYTRRAGRVMDQLAKAGDEGLNPEIYHVSTMKRVAGVMTGDAERRMQARLSLELLMSNAILNYANDMHAGSVRPQWDTGLTAMSATEQANLLGQIASASDAAGQLANLSPSTPDYLAMKEGLRNYQAIAAKGGWPEFAVGKTIKPGMNDARVADLEKILTITGDMKASDVTAGTIYSAAAVEGVKHFQQRHSLEADGIVNTATQQALAVPVGKRVEQMAMTMERMRWMPRDLGSRYVLVNVPAYRLRAVAGEQQMTMKVIVGKPDTKTPMFSKNITDVVLNPSWSVPGKIAMKEMLPKIRKNPNYLNNAGFTVTENGAKVDPSSIDWESVDKGNFNYTFRQPPGDGNALGKVKFLIPDSDNVYLHDTSQPKLFARAERSLSHGCVRLSEPKEFTKFVLMQEGWSADKVETAYESSASRTVAIAPMPVHLVYWTSWVDEQGAPHFQRDIYGMDRSLLASMSVKPSGKDDNVKLAMN